MRNSSIKLTVSIRNIQIHVFLNSGERNGVHLAEKEVIETIDKPQLVSGSRPRLGEINKTMIRIHESTAFKVKRYFG